MEIKQIEKLWKKWCEDNNVEPLVFKSKNAYGSEIIKLESTDRGNHISINMGNSLFVNELKNIRVFTDFYELLNTLQEVDEFDSVDDWLESEFKKINNRVSIKFTDDSITVIYKYLDNDVDEFEFYKDDILSNIIDIIKYMSSDVNKIEKLIKLVKTYKMIKEIQ